MTRLFAALKAKHWALLDGSLLPARLMVKSYYKNNEMIFNYYYYRGDIDIKDNWKNAKIWKEVYEELAATALRTKDPIDIGLADFVGWPIINNNLITNYKYKDRLSLYALCYGKEFAAMVFNEIKQTKIVESVEAAAVLNDYWKEWKWQGGHVMLKWMMNRLADTFGPIIIKKPLVRTGKKPYFKARDAEGMWLDFYYGDERAYDELYDGIKTQWESISDK